MIFGQSRPRILVARLFDGLNYADRHCRLVAWDPIGKRQIHREVEHEIAAVEVAHPIALMFVPKCRLRNRRAPLRSLGTPIPPKALYHPLPRCSGDLSENFIQRPATEAKHADDLIYSILACTDASLHVETLEPIENLPFVLRPAIRVTRFRSAQTHFQSGGIKPCSRSERVEHA